MKKNLMIFIALLSMSNATFSFFGGIGFGGGWGPGWGYGPYYGGYGKGAAIASGVGLGLGLLGPAIASSRNDRYYSNPSSDSGVSYSAF